MAQKKIACQPLTQRRAMLEQDHERLSLRRQCWLLSVSRAGLSYQPVAVDEQNLQIMRRLDEWYMEHPDLGHRRLVVLLREEGWLVNIKRIRRLRALMGLEAQFPKPNLSKPGVPRQRFFYLLKGLIISTVHQVWATDITTPAARLYSHAKRFLLRDGYYRFAQPIHSPLAVEQHVESRLVCRYLAAEPTRMGLSSNF